MRSNTFRSISYLNCIIRHHNIIVISGNFYQKFYNSLPSFINQVMHRIHLETRLSSIYAHTRFICTESQVLFTYHLLYTKSYRQSYVAYSPHLQMSIPEFTASYHIDNKNILSTLYRSHREQSDRQHESESGESTEQSKIQVS